ncbi:protein FAR1-RELATED SEQUENCE 2-like [Camellia sinensis]|uniref:protein FAR1-RELATED SEQUENCE 2-like n=1 Tax=Camellia sinensis TaxID=4442 RepID=UPI001035DF19|nr:protein FAR1-RELATED SEQUENCE 2-like [Camellia sinensis]
MDIGSNNPSLNGTDEVEEAENNPLVNEIGEIEELKKGMCFNLKQEIYAFYATYTKHLGFAVAYRTQNIGQAREVKYFGIECTRARKRTKRSEVHPLEPFLSLFIECEAKRRLEINDEAGIGVARNFHSIVVEAGRYEALTFDERDARNHIESMRRLRLGADARSRVTYKAFGYLVSFDTTYLTNKYDMPFALFVGVNHHGQSILLGCGMSCNESTETFVWLFREWLSCTSDAPPKAIIMDQCRAMQNAIEVVFLQARHRWCLWHIMNKILEKLREYAQYESIKFALQIAVYDSFTKDEFDEEWQAMIAKFNLDDNEWLGF